VKFRIIAIAGGISVLLVMVALRIVQLTMADSPDLTRLARRQHRESIQIAAQRGPILDRHGDTLASSVDRSSIFVRPARITDRARVSRDLAAALAMPVQTVASRLGRDASFVWVKRAVSARERDVVRALDRDGVGEVTEARRYYPHGRAAAHVLGFAGVDLQGLEGIERYYEHDLRAAPRTLEVERDARGREILSDGVDTEARQGATVQLTIDIGLQDVVERALEDGVQAAGARSGLALVLDPWTGEILALANWPGFDPNDRGSAVASRRRNRVVTDFYEPGSTFKALLVAAAVEHGLVRSDEKIFCENGRFPVGKWTIHDHHPHGWLSVAEILQVSSNIGAAKIGERVGRERLRSFLSDFGIGEPTGVDLPGEVGGLLRPLGDWSRITLVTTSFGQGVAVTPLQLARAYAAIANGGLLVQPYVGLRAVASDGVPVWEHRPQVVRRVMRPQTAAAVTTMLERVLEEGGTGTKAQVAGFRVAGKTGTAQKIDVGTGHYSAHGRIASFVGFLPAEAPRAVVLALVDEPRTSTYGGIVAAPIFQVIAAAAMERLGVSADQPAGVLEAALEASPPVPAVPETVTRVGVPSFLGLSMHTALARARDLGWIVQVDGNGYVIEQTPAPGAAAAPGKTLKLRLAAAGDSL
jgi:cell division protein FtsI (penicillin-binding protein 3)